MHTSNYAVFKWIKSLYENGLFDSYGCSTGLTSEYMRLLFFQYLLCSGRANLGRFRRKDLEIQNGKIK